jgi:pimeloyl-ACP methyl ester carboxylesterase
VRAVVAYEGPKSWAPWWPGGGAQIATAETPAEDAAEWFMRRMIGDDMWDRLPASMRAERRAEGPTLVAEMRSVRPPNPPPFDASAVAVPVLAAFGTETRMHHMRATDELARTVPRGELRMVEGAGHGAHLSHPAGFADLVRRALELASEPV